MVIRTIRCRSILNKSGIPGIDFAINPYVGCSHKCQYCYAVFMKRFSGHTEPWGDFVDVKINAPEILARQVKRLTRKSAISFGTVCDAYQPLEKKYEITRQCLKALIPYKHEVSILTKSGLVVRDLDLLRQLKHCEVGFTVVSCNQKIKEIFEPGSPPVKKRYLAERKLADCNIPTWVFVAPVLPSLTDSEKDIQCLFRESKRAGAHYIMFDTLNPYPTVWHNMKRIVKEHFPERIEFLDYYYNNQEKYTRQLRRLITRTGRQYKLRTRFAF